MISDRIGHFTVMDGSEGEGDLVLIQTFFFFFIFFYFFFLLTEIFITTTTLTTLSLQNLRLQKITIKN